MSAKITSLSVSLARPLSFVKDGFPTVVTELAIRKPTREEAKLLSDKVGLDQTFALLALLSDVPVSAIEELRARDFYAVCQVLGKI